MNEYQLSEEELYILDVITNLEPLLQYEITGFWLPKNQSLATEQVEEIVKKLVNLQLISVTKREYQTQNIISLNISMKEKVMNLLSDFWKCKQVETKILWALAEKNYTGVLKLRELGYTYENKTKVGFSDYYRDSQLHDFCLMLLDNNMVFKHTWSSKKHDYEDYYFRKIPVDVEKTLQDFILSKVNLEELKLETDWRVMAILLFSEITPKIGDIGQNFPDLTSDEVNEILSRLESRGVVTVDREELKLPKATKDIIKSFFILNQYQAFKNLLILQLRKRIGERISNLFLLGLIKRILTSIRIQRPLEPFCTIGKNLLTNVNENDLREAVKLGIVLLTEREVIIAHEVLLELETILRSAISDKSPLIRIPANDVYTAIVTWRKIFGECKDYIKIQDEYVSEETLQIVQSYSPRQTNIKILSSIEGARDTDIEEMKQRVSAIRKAGIKIELFFIGDNEEKAPFHYRYIISKDVCYAITTSIKQVGKSKDADLIPISKEEKEGLIEPAFNYWIDLSKEKLNEIGVNRMNFDEWIKHKSPSQSA